MFFTILSQFFATGGKFALSIGNRGFLRAFSGLIQIPEENFLISCQCENFHQSFKSRVSPYGDFNLWEAVKHTDHRKERICVPCESLFGIPHLCCSCGSVHCLEARECFLHYLGWLGILLHTSYHLKNCTFFFCKLENGALFLIKGIKLNIIGRGYLCLKCKFFLLRFENGNIGY